MIVIDSSALLTILLPESDAKVYSDRLSLDHDRLISAATMMETGMVLMSRRSEERAAQLGVWLNDFQIAVRPLTSEQAMIALDAFRRFGKGRHSAGLNICDCFAYALAKEQNASLLFKGGDFAKTDITPAL